MLCLKVSTRFKNARTKPNHHEFLPKPKYIDYKYSTSNKYPQDKIQDHANLSRTQKSKELERVEYSQRTKIQNCGQDIGTVSFRDTLSFMA